MPGVREVIAAAYPPELVAAQAARFSWQANAAALAEYYQRLLTPPPACWGTGQQAGSTSGAPYTSRISRKAKLGGAMNSVLLAP